MSKDISEGLLDSEASLNRQKPLMRIVYKNIASYMVFLILGLPGLIVGGAVFFARKEFSIAHNFPVIVFLIITLPMSVLAIYRIIRLIKNNDIVRVYESGVWLNNTNVFIPYRSMASIDLIPLPSPSVRGCNLPSMTRIASITVNVASDERTKYLARSINLQLSNFRTPDHQVKFELGTLEDLIYPPVESSLRFMHDLAIKDAAKSGYASPELRIESK